jgi:two-component system CheB/CheR fusion protein
LVQFLEHVPADSGMAFAIIQHLDPTQKGMLPE